MQSVYEAAGGDAGLLRLAEAWHRRVLADEVVSHAFHGGASPDHTRRLAAYWGEALGGPPAYSAQYGDESFVVRLHSGNGVHEEMDRRAIACFDEAMVDAGLAGDDRLRRTLHEYFAWATTTSMAGHPASADDVPAGLTIARWSWNGLEGGPMDFGDLDDGIDGDVVLPGQQAWDTARQAWNLSVDQRPIAIVYPESADDVAATIVFAAERDLRIAFNAGGHNAGPIDWSRDTLLLKTERMRGITIDPVARRARVEAGVLAKDLAVAAGGRGLAYLAGTSPDVGVFGYALGGGLSWMVRTFGLACNSILSADVVTAGGRVAHADRDTEPDLFWAIRGGGGNVAAVTAIELQLFPITQIYAGTLFWPIERATEILRAWRTWIDGVPESCESLGRMLQLPDAPFLPDHLRGRSFVLVEAAILGDEREAAALIQPLRDLGPVMDTLATMPPSELSQVNMDPDFPLPYAGEGVLLDDLPTAAIDGIVEAFVGSALLHVEVRHLGGAAAVRSPDHGVLDAIDQPFVAFTFGFAPDEAAMAAVAAGVGRVLASLRPWDSGRRYLNFAESQVDPRTIYPPEGFDRFLEVKARYDPDDRFAANHPVTRAVRV